MTKVQRPKAEVPSRRDSFSRMLELEKQYKMQRTQLDHNTTTTALPNSSAPSSYANLAPNRARRMSAYPPLSHQTQIMKAVRRTSPLPSLSISIPPSPTDTVAVRTDGNADDPPNTPGREERSKTVTFSDPEEEEGEHLSDESSICQSPSWEQYSRKKPKRKPKKKDTELSAKEKEDKLWKKRGGNRLSKYPPQVIPGVRPLTAADRSRSAPELELYTKSDRDNLPPPRGISNDTMTNPNLDGKGPPAPQSNTKSKSKGFLSSFRMQHGNVAAVNKLIETSRTSVDDPRPINQTHTGPPLVQKSHSNGPAVDLGHGNTRKPASIRSVVSTSTPSVSSSEKRNSATRSSTSSSHGRSQSLLSSTLNKLKGPSYLYYHPTEEADASQTRRPNSSGGAEPVSDGLYAAPSELLSERLNGRSITALEHTRPAPDFTFHAPKPRRATTEPGPDIAPRARPPRPRKVDSREQASGIESLAKVHNRSRKVQSESSQAADRDSVMAMVVAQEKQSRTDRLSHQPKPHTQKRAHTGRNINHGPELDRRRPSPDYPRMHSHRPTGVASEFQRSPEVGHSPQEEDIMTPDATCTNRLDIQHYDTQEDDQTSVGTHSSTIRPHSRSQEGYIAEWNRGHPALAVSPKSSTIGRAFTSGEVKNQRQASPDKRSSPEDLITFEVDTPDTIQQPLKPQRSADYFTFVNESYAPPSLELRSPTEGKFPSSPRIPEEPEEEEEEVEFFHNHPLNEKKRTFHNEDTHHMSQNTVAPQSFTASRVSYEQKPKSSPVISAHQSDSDLPALERLGISPKAAKILAQIETSSTSTAQSRQTEPSLSTSERSSSSTYDDAPPSSSSATTPDSLRPQSQKGTPTSYADISQITLVGSSIEGDPMSLRMAYRQPSVGQPENAVSQSNGREPSTQEDEWTQSAIPVDNEPHQAPSMSRLNVLRTSPPLVATPTSVTFADDLKDEMDGQDEALKKLPRLGLPPRSQSALELHPTTKLLPSALKHQPLQSRAKASASSVSLPSSPPPELADDALPRKSALKMSRNNSGNSQDSSALVSAGAAYLQEARRTAPGHTPTSRALRPGYVHKNSSGSIKSAVSANNRGAEPMAKMLVECCNCKFFHDMPSRVYECMAKPDSVVEDKLLGVSAAITTMVKCPWCAHGMTTTCCSGYAAVVYLKEKLHGK